MRCILRKINRKKAVSLMVSYVLLVAIVLTVSIGVFVFLKLVSNIEPVTDCKEGTSLILESTECEGKINLLLRNNGRFSVEGVILTVGNNLSNAPIYLLMPDSSGGYMQGHYLFPSKLKPGEVAYANFTNNWINQSSDNFLPGKIWFDFIETIKIQPYITSKGEIVPCSASAIEQDIQECRISS